MGRDVVISGEGIRGGMGVMEDVQMESGTLRARDFPGFVQLAFFCHSDCVIGDGAARVEQNM